MESVLDTIVQLNEGRRSVRTFEQTPIEVDTLLNMVDNARLCPSGGNRQPLRYVIVTDEDMRDSIFPCIKWASYIAPQRTPDEEHRPTAYIAVCIDSSVCPKADIDVGAACMTINLIAESEGIGVCWLGAIDRPKISELLDIHEPIELQVLLALGYKAESPKAVEYAGDVKYYLDDTGTLCVPKHKLDEVTRII